MLHFKNICAIIIVAIAQNLLLRINSVLSALRLFFMCNAARAEDKAEFFCIWQKIGCFNAANCHFCADGGQKPLLRAVSGPDGAAPAQ